MSVVNDIIKDIPLPNMVKVRQDFDRTRLENVAAEVRKSLERREILGNLRPGMTVAVAVGSRGISNHALIVRETVRFLRDHGARPFIVSSMGSHGGATAEGQRAILEGYGIREEYCGCPIKAGTDCALIGYTGDGSPVYIDRYAAEADGIVLVNRIKPHTAFRGPYESGLMKMMAIGLGKQKGAETCHAAGFENMAENIPRFAAAVLKNCNILAGIAILENAYDETREVIALAADEIPAQEPELLERAKRYMPRILVDYVDLLVVGQIGKNFSGDGMDPNIAGTFATKCASGGLNTKRVAVLDISDESHGNGVGFGMADVSTRRAYEKFDFEMSYPNALTCLVSQVVKVPMIFDSDQLCLKAGIKLCAGIEHRNARVVYIHNTLKLGEIYISANLVPQAEAVEGITVAGEERPMEFDGNGNLISI
ncbi:lactate racemase domain-containing protein [Enterocloster asparagiformis]|uniref:lactate racemase domain-containing protein n=1 Tax=Enterocloster asparagiformis TaxID=333367 RepID=UPI000466321D|nr:lactate racemase domain-containing protein [Enterocloster asparagiformis]